MIMSEQGIQERFDFRPKESSEGILVQCPAESCRNTFLFLKEKIQFTKGIPFAQCPCCRLWFEVKAHGKNGYHTLLEGVA